MAKFQVRQIVQCDVHVWYQVEADSMAEAESIVAKNDTPTCVDGADFEIVADGAISGTKITKIEEA